MHDRSLPPGNHVAITGTARRRNRGNRRVAFGGVEAGSKESWFTQWARHLKSFAGPHLRPGFGPAPMVPGRLLLIQQNAGDDRLIGCVERADYWKVRYTPRLRRMSILLFESVCSWDSCQVAVLPVLEVTSVRDDDRLDIVAAPARRFKPAEDTPCFINVEWKRRQGTGFNREHRWGQGILFKAHVVVQREATTATTHTKQRAGDRGAISFPAWGAMVVDPALMFHSTARLIQNVAHFLEQLLLSEDFKT